MKLPDKVRRWFSFRLTLLHRLSEAEVELALNKEELCYLRGLAAKLQAEQHDLLHRLATAEADAETLQALWRQTKREHRSCCEALDLSQSALSMTQEALHECKGVQGDQLVDDDHMWAQG